MSINDAPSLTEYVGRRAETDRRGHSRQIQPLACVSKTGSDKGVCMFAWNCVEAGGKHLGTCIDRFYFGSCCKLPDNSENSPIASTVASDVDNSIDSENRGSDGEDNDVSENEISDERPSLKPIGGSASSSSSDSTTSSTTILSLSPITTTQTTTTTTTSTTSTTTTPTTTAPTTTTTTTTPTTTTPTTTTISTTTTTTSTTSTTTHTTTSSTTHTTTSSTTTSTTTTTTSTSTTTTTTSKAATTFTATTLPEITVETTESGIQTTEITPSSIQTTTDSISTTIDPIEIESSSADVTDIVGSTETSSYVTATTLMETTNEAESSTSQTSGDIEELSVTISVGDVTSAENDVDTTQNAESNEKTTVSSAQSTDEKQTTTTSTITTSSGAAESTTSTESNNDATPLQEVLTVAPVIADTTDDDLTVDPVVVESADEFSGSNTDDETKPNTDTWVPLQVGADGGLQEAIGLGGAKPQQGQFYNCSVISEGVYNCSIVDGPSKGESLVTTDLSDIKNLIDSTGGVGKPVIIDYEDVIEPEAPIAPAVTPSPTDKPTDKPTEQTTLPTRESSTEKPLHSMTFKEACGRTPWLNETFRSIHASPRSARMIGRNPKVNNLWKQLNRRGKIVNGEKAEYGEWPWQVSLRQWRTATFLHKCGAALLSENWAITAAHCVESVNPDELLLRMGEYDLNDEFDEPYTFQDRKVQIVASHPKFDPKTFEYDLALLRFYEPVTFQPNIIPVCIPEDDANLVGKTAWVTGWGRLYEDGPLPAVLQEVDLPIINNTECEAMYEKAGFREHIPDIFICAGYREGGKDSCEVGIHIKT